MFPLSCQPYALGQDVMEEVRLVPQDMVEVLTPPAMFRSKVRHCKRLSILLPRERAWMRNGFEG